VDVEDRAFENANGGDGIDSLPEKMGPAMARSLSIVSGL
jgi:hypothetical protein